MRDGTGITLIDLDWVARAPREYDLSSAARRFRAGEIDRSTYRRVLPGLRPRRPRLGGAASHGSGGGPRRRRLPHLGQPSPRPRPRLAARTSCGCGARRCERRADGRIGDALTAPGAARSLQAPSSGRGRDLSQSAKASLLTAPARRACTCASASDPVVPSRSRTTRVTSRPERLRPKVQWTRTVCPSRTSPATSAASRTVRPLVRHLLAVDERALEIGQVRHVRRRAGTRRRRRGPRRRRCRCHAPSRSRPGSRRARDWGGCASAGRRARRPAALRARWSSSRWFLRQFRSPSWRPRDV